MTLQRFADMGLSDGETIWNSYPPSLSGGMNQRVGIALAMLLHPSLLLADEPTSALDVVSQAQVLRELQALQQKEQTGMVLVTHNLAVLEQMADRVAVLKDGNIVEQGRQGWLSITQRTNIQKSPCGCAGKREERCIIITCWK